MPIISPRPRTSPTISCFFTQPLTRSRMCFPTLAALSIALSSSTSMVASAAAMHTGLPPKVDACDPGTQSMISALLMHTLSGMPLAMPLATVIMSGSTPECCTDHHLPVRPEPACTSSHTSRMPYLSQIRRNSCMNSVGATRYPPSPWIGSTKIAAVSSGGTVVLNTLSSMKRAQSIAYCFASVPSGLRYTFGYGTWVTPGTSGKKRRRCWTLDAVSDSAPMVRPWNAP